MLCLTRKVGERIQIGDDVTVTVLRNGKNVRLGIEAPEGVSIHRAEVAAAIAAGAENPLQLRGREAHEDQMDLAAQAVQREAYQKRKREEAQGFERIEYAAERRALPGEAVAHG